MKREVLFENEMEQLQIKMGYKPFDNDGTVDSVSVFDNAIEHMGYTPYKMYGEGEYDETYIFIKNL